MYLLIQVYYTDGQSEIEKKPATRVMPVIISVERYYTF